jgi:uncharacterized membrane protein
MVRKPHELGVLIAILSHLAIVVPLAFVLPLWVDELYTVHTASLRLVESMQRAIGFERQAPLYFGLVSLWAKVCAAPVAMRIPSVIFTTLTLVACAAISRRVIPTRSPALLTVIVGLHPLFIFAATEARVYGAIALLSSLLILAYIVIFVDGTTSWRGVLGFGTLCAVAVYTHYYLGFVIVGLGVTLLVNRERVHLRGFLMSLGVCAALCAPILSWLPSQIDTSDGIVPEHLSWLGVAKFSLALIEGTTLPLLRELVARAQGSVFHAVVAISAHAVFLLLIILILRRASAQGQSLPDKLSRFRWWIVVVCNAVLLSLVGKFVATHLVSLPRYWISLIVPGTLALLSVAEKALRKNATLTLAAILAVSNLVMTWQDFSPLAKTTDARRVASYIAESEAKGQPIVVFPNWYVQPIEHYYRGANSLVPLPSRQSLTNWSVSSSVVRSEEEIERSIRAIAPNCDEIWLVTERLDTEKGDLLGINTNLGQNILREYFARRYSTVKERLFYHGLSVKLLRRNVDRFTGLHN